MSVSSMSPLKRSPQSAAPTLCCQVNVRLPQRKKVASGRQGFPSAFGTWSILEILINLPSDYWKGCHCSFTHLFWLKGISKSTWYILIEYNSDLLNQHLLSDCIFIARISPSFINVHPWRVFCLPSHRVLSAHISLFYKSFHFCCHGYYPADSTLPPCSAMVTAQLASAFAHAQCAVLLDPISYFNGPNKRARDIRKMATALVVSAPQHIPRFFIDTFFSRLKRKWHLFTTTVLI